MFFINVLKKRLYSQKKCFVLPGYNIENINIIHISDMQFVINDQLFLETLLMNIRSKTISYASYKKKNDNKIELELIKDIGKIEKSLSSDNLIILENKKQELDY